MPIRRLAVLLCALQLSAACQAPATRQWLDPQTAVTITAQARPVQRRAVRRAAAAHPIDAGTGQAGTGERPYTLWRGTLTDLQAFAAQLQD